MATIELDIIKQRNEKLPPSEKIDLIRYLTASLTSEERIELSDLPELDEEDRTNREETN